MQERPTAKLPRRKEMISSFKGVTKQEKRKDESKMLSKFHGAVKE
jgi:hypothetical protein